MSSTGTEHSPVPFNSDVLGYLEFSESYSEILAGIFTNFRESWIACGSKLVVINNSNCSLCSAWTFGAGQNDLFPVIKCVTELPISNYPCSLLLVGLNTSLGYSLLCVYHPLSRCVIRTLKLDFNIQVITIISEDNNLTNPLPEILSKMDGVLAIGADDGSVILVDLSRSFINKVIGGDMDGMIDETRPRKLCFIDCLSDNAATVTAKMDLCAARGDSLAIPLNDGENGVMVPYKMAGSSVTTMYYCKEASSLLVGYSTGSWQLWNMTSFDLMYTSPCPKGHCTFAIHGFRVLEPCDDPRHTLYIWVTHQSTGINGSNPLVAMYTAHFKDKNNIKDYGPYYQNFQQCSLSFEMDLNYDKDCSGDGNMVSCCSVSKSLPRTLLHCAKYPDPEMLPLRLFVTMWESWSSSKECLESYVTIFDLNQWYREQMPSRTRRFDLKSDCPYLITRHFPSGKVVAAGVPTNTLNVYTSIQPLEQHFYPSALSFDCLLVGEDGLVSYRCKGVQERTLLELGSYGSSALVRPTAVFRAVVGASLVPVYSEPLDIDHPNVEDQRNYVLTICLENNLSNVVLSCAHLWYTGSHCVTGCTLNYLLNFLWHSLTNYKRHFDIISAPLFDQSGVSFDVNSKRRLQHCKFMMQVIESVHSKIFKKYSAFIISGDIEQRLEAMQLFLLYYEMIMWFCGVDILPEQSWKGEPDSTIPYNFNMLFSFCTQRREALKNSPTLTTNGRPVGKLLMIDALIDEEAGSRVVDQWGLEEDKGLSHFYPPPSIQSLIRICLMAGVRNAAKHAIIMYFLLDLVELVNFNKYQKSIECILKYRFHFSVPEGQMKVVQAFWHLDHCNFEEAVQCLLSRSVIGNNLREWQHRMVLRLLVSQSQNKLALCYLHIKRPSLNLPDDVKLEMSLLLSNLHITQAFMFQRSNKHLRESLLNQFFKGCVETDSLEKVFSLPLDKFEERAFESFLKSTHLANSDSLQVLYLLSRTKYVEAIEVHDKLSQQRTRRRLNHSNVGEQLERQHPLHITHHHPYLAHDDAIFKATGLVVKGIAGTIPNVSRSIPIMSTKIGSLLSGMKGKPPKPLSGSLKMSFEESGAPNLKNTRDEVMAFALAHQRHLEMSTLHLNRGLLYAEDDANFSGLSSRNKRRAGEVEVTPTPKRVKKTSEFEIEISGDKFKATPSKADTPGYLSTVENLVSTPIIKRKEEHLISTPSLSNTPKPLSILKAGPTEKSGRAPSPSTPVLRSKTKATRKATTKRREAEINISKVLRFQLPRGSDEFIPVEDTNNVQDAKEIIDNREEENEDGVSELPLVVETEDPPRDPSPEPELTLERIERPFKVSGRKSMRRLDAPTTPLRVNSSSNIASLPTPTTPLNEPSTSYRDRLRTRSASKVMPADSTVAQDSKEETSASHWAEEVNRDSGRVLFAHATPSSSSRKARRTLTTPETRSANRSRKGRRKSTSTTTTTTAFTAVPLPFMDLDEDSENIEIGGLGASVEEEAKKIEAYILPKLGQNRSVVRGLRDPAGTSQESIGIREGSGENETPTSAERRDPISSSILTSREVMGVSSKIESRQKELQEERLNRRKSIFERRENTVRLVEPSQVIRQHPPDIVECRPVEIWPIEIRPAESQPAHSSKSTRKVLDQCEDKHSRQKDKINKESLGVKEEGNQTLLLQHLEKRQPRKEVICNQDSSGIIQTRMIEVDCNLKSIKENKMHEVNLPSEKNELLRGEANKTWRRQVDSSGRRLETALSNKVLQKSATSDISEGVRTCNQKEHLEMSSSNEIRTPQHNSRISLDVTKDSKVIEVSVLEGEQKSNYVQEEENDDPGIPEVEERTTVESGFSDHDRVPSDVEQNVRVIEACVQEREELRKEAVVLQGAAREFPDVGDEEDDTTYATLQPVSIAIIESSADKITSLQDGSPDEVEVINLDSGGEQGAAGDEENVYLEGNGSSEGTSPPFGLVITNVFSGPDEYFKSCITSEGGEEEQEEEIIDEEEEGIDEEEEGTDEEEGEEDIYEGIDEFGKEDEEDEASEVSYDNKYEDEDSDVICLGSDSEGSDTRPKVSSHGGSSKEDSTVDSDESGNDSSCSRLESNESSRDNTISSGTGLRSGKTVSDLPHHNDVEMYTTSTQEELQSTHPTENEGITTKPLQESNRATIEKRDKLNSSKEEERQQLSSIPDTGHASPVVGFITPTDSELMDSRPNECEETQASIEKTRIPTEVITSRVIESNDLKEQEVPSFDEQINQVEAGGVTAIVSEQTHSLNEREIPPSTKDYEHPPELKGEYTQENFQKADSFCEEILIEEISVEDDVQHLAELSGRQIVVWDEDTGTSPQNAPRGGLVRDHQMVLDRTENVDMVHLDVSRKDDPSIPIENNLSPEVQKSDNNQVQKEKVDELVRIVGIDVKLGSIEQSKIISHKSDVSVDQSLHSDVKPGYVALMAESSEVKPQNFHTEIIEGIQPPEDGHMKIEGSESPSRKINTWMHCQKKSELITFVGGAIEQVDVPKSGVGVEITSEPCSETNEVMKSLGESKLSSNQQEGSHSDKKVCDELQMESLEVKIPVKTAECKPYDDVQKPVEGVEVNSQLDNSKSLLGDIPFSAKIDLQKSKDMGQNSSPTCDNIKPLVDEKMQDSCERIKDTATEMHSSNEVIDINLAIYDLPKNSLKPTDIEISSTDIIRNKDMDEDKVVVSVSDGLTTVPENLELTKIPEISESPSTKLQIENNIKATNDTTGPSSSEGMDIILPTDDIHKSSLNTTDVDMSRNANIRHKDMDEDVVVASVSDGLSTVPENSELSKIPEISESPSTKLQMENNIKETNDTTGPSSSEGMGIILPTDDIPKGSLNTTDVDMSRNANIRNKDMDEDVVVASVSDGLSTVPENSELSKIPEISESPSTKLQMENNIKETNDTTGPSSSEGMGIILPTDDIPKGSLNTTDVDMSRNANIRNKDMDEDVVVASVSDGLSTVPENSELSKIPEISESPSTKLQMENNIKETNDTKANTPFSSEGIDISLSKRDIPNSSLHPTDIEISSTDNIRNKDIDEGKIVVSITNDLATMPKKLGLTKISESPSKKFQCVSDSSLVVGSLPNPAEGVISVKGQTSNDLQGSEGDIEMASIQDGCQLNEAKIISTILTEDSRSSFDNNLEESAGLADVAMIGSDSSDDSRDTVEFSISILEEQGRLVDQDVISKQEIPEEEMNCEGMVVKKVSVSKSMMPEKVLRMRWSNQDLEKEATEEMDPEVKHGRGGDSVGGSEEKISEDWGMTNKVLRSQKSLLHGDDHKVLPSIPRLKDEKAEPEIGSLKALSGKFAEDENDIKSCGKKLFMDRSMMTEKNLRSRRSLLHGEDCKVLKSSPRLKNKEKDNAEKGSLETESSEMEEDKKFIEARGKKVSIDRSMMTDKTVKSRKSLAHVTNREVLPSSSCLKDTVKVPAEKEDITESHKLIEDLVKTGGKKVFMERSMMTEKASTSRKSMHFDNREKLPSTSNKGKPDSPEYLVPDEYVDRPKAAKKLSIDKSMMTDITKFRKKVDLSKKLETSEETAVSQKLMTFPKDTSKVENMNLVLDLGKNRSQETTPRKRRASSLQPESLSSNLEPFKKLKKKSVSFSDMRIEIVQEPEECHHLRTRSKHSIDIFDRAEDERHHFYPSTKIQRGISRTCRSKEADSSEDEETNVGRIKPKRRSSVEARHLDEVPHVKHSSQDPWRSRKSTDGYHRQSLKPIRTEEQSLSDDSEKQIALKKQKKKYSVKAVPSKELPRDVRYSRRSRKSSGNQKRSLKIIRYEEHPSSEDDKEVMGGLPENPPQDVRQNVRGSSLNEDKGVRHSRKTKSQRHSTVAEENPRHSDRSGGSKTARFEDVDKEAWPREQTSLDEETSENVRLSRISSEQDIRVALLKKGMNENCLKLRRTSGIFKPLKNDVPKKRPSSVAGFPIARKRSSVLDRFSTLQDIAEESSEENQQGLRKSLSLQGLEAGTSQSSGMLSLWEAMEANTLSRIHKWIGDQEDKPPARSPTVTPKRRSSKKPRFFDMEIIESSDEEIPKIVRTAVPRGCSASPDLDSVSVASETSGKLLRSGKVVDDSPVIRSPRRAARGSVGSATPTREDSGSETSSVAKKPVNKPPFNTLIEKAADLFNVSTPEVGEDKVMTRHQMREALNQSMNSPNTTAAKNLRVNESRSSEEKEVTNLSMHTPKRPVKKQQKKKSTKVSK